jgi:hypothetical protein
MSKKAGRRTRKMNRVEGGAATTAVFTKSDQDALIGLLNALYTRYANANANANAPKVNDQNVLTSAGDIMTKIANYVSNNQNNQNPLVL